MVSRECQECSSTCFTVNLRTVVYNEDISCNLDDSNVCRVSIVAKRKHPTEWMKVVLFRTIPIRKPTEHCLIISHNIRQVPLL